MISGAAKRNGRPVTFLISCTWIRALNLDFFEGMVNQIYPPELQVQEVNTSDTGAPFLDLHLSIPNGFVSSKIDDKRDDF